MKRKEAIKMLRLYEVNDLGEGELETWYKGIDEDMREALDIAIEALSAEKPPYCVIKPRPPFMEPKTWHEKNSHTYICGDCGFEQAIYGNIREYNCCPRCGVYKEYVDYGYMLPQKRTPYREDGDSE